MELLNKLYSVNLFAEKNGLENMLRLSAHAGNPEKFFRCVHIAGSNGKGSVSTKIAAGLQQSGFKTGLFTSPHIHRFNERIKINGEDISDADLEIHLKQAFRIAEECSLNATYFELVTLTAFLYYRAQNVDFVVLEAGLGGRFDATNIVTPEVSVITSISLEHTEILGNTIEAIAREKAGIAKEGVPIVIGPTVSFSVVRERTSLIEPVTGIYETFFEENNAVAGKAMEVLKLSATAIEKGLQATPPCRMQIYKQDGVTIVRDVGHNPGAIKQLLIALERKHGWKKFHTLCSFSSNKDIKSCFELLEPACATMTLLPPTQPRLATVEQMTALLPPTLSNYQASWPEICALSRQTRHPILITGSFYIDIAFSNTKDDHEISSFRRLSEERLAQQKAYSTSC